MATDQSNTTTDHAQLATDQSTPDRTERDDSLGSDQNRDDPYEIRPYEPADRDDYLELYDQILGDRDDDWFRWKYEANPYVDHVPIVVASTDGTVVGAKPCFALEVRIGNRTTVGLQPADVLVHPDHRRQGLYSRTTERMKTRYRDRDPALFFNFPNEVTLSGSLKHGWTIVEEVPTYYRIQQPDAIVDGFDTEQAARLASLGRSVAGGYLGVRDRLVDVPSDVRVRRFDGLPVETFVDLYEQAVPRTLHANRDETFYEWRFQNPKWSYAAYVATRAGDPVAGIITGTQTRDGTRYTRLTDVVPLSPTSDRDAAVTALLDRIVRDNRDVGVISASGRVIEPSLLERFGFHSDQSFPLSWLTLPTTQVTYPIADDAGHDWTVEGAAVADPANWSITFAEQDTS